MRFFYAVSKWFNASIGFPVSRPACVGKRGHRLDERGQTRHCQLAQPSQSSIHESGSALCWWKMILLRLDHPDSLGSTAKASRIVLVSKCGRFGEIGLIAPQEVRYPLESRRKVH